MWVAQHVVGSQQALGRLRRRLRPGDGAPLDPESPEMRAHATLPFRRAGGDPPKRMPDAKTRPPDNGTTGRHAPSRRGADPTSWHSTPFSPTHHATPRGIGAPREAGGPRAKGLLHRRAVVTSTRLRKRGVQRARPVAAASPACGSLTMGMSPARAGTLAQSASDPTQTPARVIALAQARRATRNSKALLRWPLQCICGRPHKPAPRRQC